MSKYKRDEEGMFGPVYPALPTVDKHRRKARAAGSVAAMAPEDRRAYGQAVLSALAALSAPKAPAHHCPCASGTWHSDGKAILKAVRSQQRSG